MATILRKMALDDGIGMPKTTVVVCDVMRRPIGAGPVHYGTYSWTGFILHRTTTNATNAEEFDAKTNFAIHNYLPELRQRQNRDDVH